MVSFSCMCVTRVVSLAGVSASHYKLLMEAGGAGAHDPTTTNVYLGNLHPEISEQVLMMEFGKYGILMLLWRVPSRNKKKYRHVDTTC